MIPHPLSHAFCLLACTPRPSAVTCSGLEGICSELAALKLSLQRQMMRVVYFNPGRLRSHSAAPLLSQPCALGKEGPTSESAGRRPKAPQSRGATDRPTALRHPSRKAPPLPPPGKMAAARHPRDWALAPPPKGRGPGPARRGHLPQW